MIKLTVKIKFCYASLLFAISDNYTEYKLISKLTRYSLFCRLHEPESRDSPC